MCLKRPKTTPIGLKMLAVQIRVPIEHAGVGDVGEHHSETLGHTMASASLRPDRLLRQLGILGNSKSHKVVAHTGQPC